MEHNSARIAKELGFAFKYVLDEFYRNHRDVERKARRICEENNEKTIEELKVLIKDFNVAGIKEEMVAKRSFENEQTRLNKQKLYEHFSMSAVTKRRAEEEVATVHKVQCIEVVDTPAPIIVTPTPTPTPTPVPIEKTSPIKPVECSKCKEKDQEIEKLQLKIKDLESLLKKVDDLYMIADKKNLVQETEIKCLKREAQVYIKEKEVQRTNQLKIQLELEKEKKNNHKLAAENILLKQSLATPFFQQQKKINSA